MTAEQNSIQMAVIVGYYLLRSGLVTIPNETPSKRKGQVGQMDHCRLPSGQELNHDFYYRMALSYVGERITLSPAKGTVHIRVIIG